MQKIIDTHVHLWDLERFSVPWLDTVSALRHTITLDDYTTHVEKAGSWRIEQAVYIEVDLHPSQRKEEAEVACALCADEADLITGSSVALDMSAPLDPACLARYRDSPWIKGVRHVLHVPSSPRGACLSPQFKENVALLGAYNLLFEACLRCEELDDVVVLARACPGTSIMLDHIGNVKPEYINPCRQEPDIVRYREQWLRTLERLGALPNVWCKVSGLNPDPGWKPETLRPALEACFEIFGEDRLLFGGNFPVCLLWLSLEEWIDAVLTVTAGRSQTFKNKVFFDNAQRVYSL